MIIAVTYENGEIFQHFGHTQQFKVYVVEDMKITETSIVDTQGEGHEALADFLFNGGVDVLICGGIGGGAQMAIAESGIDLYAGITGDADEAVGAYLAGSLEHCSEANCSHHDSAFEFSGGCGGGGGNCGGGCSGGCCH